MLHNGFYSSDKSLKMYWHSNEMNLLRLSQRPPTCVEEILKQIFPLLLCIKDLKAHLLADNFL